MGHLENSNLLIWVPSTCMCVKIVQSCWGKEIIGQIPCDELCMCLKVCLHQLSLQEPNIVPLNNITAVLNRDSSSRNATSSVLYASIQGLGPAWPPAFNMSHSIIRSWFNHQKIIGVRILCYPDMFMIWPWTIAWASKNVCYKGNQVYAFDTFVILEWVWGLEFWTSVQLLKLVPTGMWKNMLFYFYDLP